MQLRVRSITYLAAAINVASDHMPTQAVGEAQPGTFHVYLGYAGWSAGQLEHEVELGGWHVLPADAASVFDPEPDGLWEKLIRRTELRIAHSVRKVAIGSTLVARRAGR